MPWRNRNRMPMGAAPCLRFVGHGLDDPKGREVDRGREVEVLRRRCGRQGPTPDLGQPRARSSSAGGRGHRRARWTARRPAAAVQPSAASGSCAGPPVLPRSARDTGEGRAEVVAAPADPASFSLARGRRCGQDSRSADRARGRRTRGRRARSPVDRSWRVRVLSPRRGNPRGRPAPPLGTRREGLTAGCRGGVGPSAAGSNHGPLIRLVQVQASVKAVSTVGVSCLPGAGVERSQHPGIDGAVWIRAPR